MAENKTILQKFVAAWSEISNPDLDGVNPHYKSKYATLKSIMDVVRPACKNQGIAYLQQLEVREGDCFLKSGVTDGESVLDLSVFPIDVPPNPQSFGSNMTYIKRQQASADWFIVGEEDDDGNAASQTAQKSSQAQKGSSSASGQKQTVQQREVASPAKTNRFEKIKKLKAQAEELGIKEEGIKSWLEVTFNGKAMKDFTDAEIKATEAHIQQLINDKQELMSKEQ